MCVPQRLKPRLERALAAPFGSAQGSLGGLAPSATLRVTPAKRLKFESLRAHRY